MDTRGENAEVCIHTALQLYYCMHSTHVYELVCRSFWEVMHTNMFMMYEHHAYCS